MNPVSTAAPRGSVTFSCFGCAFARPLPSPSEDWIWCDRPGDRRLVGVVRDSTCRRRDGGVLASRAEDLIEREPREERESSEVAAGLGPRTPVIR
jgi:hypothetical protein